MATTAGRWYLVSCAGCGSFSGRTIAVVVVVVAVVVMVVVVVSGGSRIFQRGGGTLWDLVRFEHVHTGYSSMKPTPFSCIFNELINDTTYIVVWPMTFYTNLEEFSSLRV